MAGDEDKKKKKKTKKTDKPEKAEEAPPAEEPAPAPSPPAEEAPPEEIAPEEGRIHGHLPSDKSSAKTISMSHAICTTSVVPTTLFTMQDVDH